MKSVEIAARTVHDAKRQALKQLGLKENEVEIEILEESTKGFLGIIGGKQAKIRVTEKNDPLKSASSFVKDVTSIMGVKTNISAEEKDGYIRISLIGGNLGILIGRRGETLDALQYITNLFINKNLFERVKVVIDAEGYRERREETLIRLALRLASRVKKTGNRVILEPMNPQERRVIHTALQNDYAIQTLSEGEEPYRKVVISLNK